MFSMLWKTFSLVSALSLLTAFLIKTTSNAHSIGQLAPKRVSEQELLSRVKKRVEPVYPDEATAVLIFSLVPQVEVKVDRSGDVTSTRIISGLSLLRDATLEAARAWKFKPFSDRNVSEIVGVINFGPIAPLVRANSDQGISFYQEEVRKSPESWLAHTRLASAYLAHQKYTQAIREYEQAKALSPGSAAVNYGLGDCYRRSEQHAIALGYFQKAAQLEPRFVEAFVAIAAAYIALGVDGNRLYGTSQLFDRQILSLEERKDQPKIDWEKLSQAIKAYQRAAEARPDPDVRKDNLEYIADVYYLAGKIEEMVRVYEEIVKLDLQLYISDEDSLFISDPIRNLNLLAALDVKLGRNQEAIQTYQGIVDFKPNSEEAFEASLEMASLYTKDGKQDKATEICQKWLAWVDREAKRVRGLRADYLRGRLYHAMGRYQDAIASFRKAEAKKSRDSIAENEWLYELYTLIGDQKAAAEQKAIIVKAYDEQERPLREGKIIKIK